jgi:NADH-quinone oxidoreductase subunit E/NADP-reducing hydrogenase subunit HndA
MVGEKVYGRVSPQQVRKIIAEYQEGCVRVEKHEM